MSSYLVTGCAGFIGSHLCDSLLAEGHQVTGIDSFTDFYDPAIKEANVEGSAEHAAFTLVRGDLTAVELESIVADVDGVFHLAAHPGVRQSWQGSYAMYLSNNVHATQRIFDTCADQGKRVVYASSSSVYGEAAALPTPEDAPCHPISPYGVTKLACEHLAHVYRLARGLSATGLRYFTVYGPRQRPDMAFAGIAESLSRERPFEIFGDGRQSRDVTYVTDAISATVAAMQPAAQRPIYNVGGGSVASLLEAVGMFERAAGHRLETRHKPGVLGDIRETFADTTALHSDLGWKPATDLRDGIVAHFDWVNGGLQP